VGSEGQWGRVIGDRDVRGYSSIEAAAAAAYHSIQSIPHSRITMTTMLDRPMMITRDMFAITSSSSPLASRHDNINKMQS